ncbi:unnamed protein product [Schistosoma margrebowiei]|uniref:Uncharacterized protein n=1 Tax=Schistosoma margrebowiei TaxID=48269 RepID=A0A183LXA3_9TREM|nr:unnamed protein product [Schistosoma margrebowiei]
MMVEGSQQRTWNRVSCYLALFSRQTPSIYSRQINESVDVHHQFLSLPLNNDLLNQHTIQGIVDSNISHELYL